MRAGMMSAPRLGVARRARVPCEELTAGRPREGGATPCGAPRAPHAHPWRAAGSAHHPHRTHAGRVRECAVRGLCGRERDVSTPPDGRSAVCVGACATAFVRERGMYAPAAGAAEGCFQEPRSPAAALQLRGWCSAPLLKIVQQGVAALSTIVSPRRPPRCCHHDAALATTPPHHQAAPREEPPSSVRRQERARRRRKRRP